MANLMKLEWRKLKQASVIRELVIYWVILMFLPVFFIKMVSADFGQSVDALFTLILSVQVGFVLLGASLISQVFIDEFKNKTIALSYSYPISRKQLFLSKVLFIGIFIFLATLISFVLTVVTTMVIDEIFSVLHVGITSSDIWGYVGDMIARSFLVTLISFIPLFYLAIWKRAVIPTVICAILVMQLPNFSPIFNLNQDLVIVILSILGAISIYFSIKFAEIIGEI
ncbi:ABC transporter permease [Ornithinibacillus sp. 179-J 7C1 HS]|uniref:ABC transporter permease n=1 Tax=Ornithinibacillus sp. 179-J 7C1 HS TaxID=3142384 RepID=UPI0039A28E1E